MTPRFPAACWRASSMEPMTAAGRLERRWGTDRAFNAQPLNAQPLNHVDQFRREGRALLNEGEARLRLVAHQALHRISRVIAILMQHSHLEQRAFAGVH